MTSQTLSATRSVSAACRSDGTGLSEVCAAEGSLLRHSSIGRSRRPSPPHRDADLWEKGQSGGLTHYGRQCAACVASDTARGVITAHPDRAARGLQNKWRGAGARCGKHAPRGCRGRGGLGPVCRPADTLECPPRRPSRPDRVTAVIVQSRHR